LVYCFWKYFTQRLPEAKGTITNCKLGRMLESLRFYTQQQRLGL